LKNVDEFDHDRRRDSINGGLKPSPIPVNLNLAVATGIGLLIGVERERRKGTGSDRSSAGMRTFTIASLTGATSLIVGGTVLVAVAVASVAVLSAAAYWLGPRDDPGQTTEVALILTVILGAYSMQQPAMAGGLSVVVAVMLAARFPLHRFASSVLSDEELEDALIFAGATLVVLPLIPDNLVGPYNALNLHSIWTLVILVMAIGGAGYIAIRTMGARYGLPIAGLASGFVSSTATIGAMGERVARSRAALAAAVAGAVLSTVATIIQMGIVLAATSLATLEKLSIPLISAGLAAAVYGAIFTVLALQQKPQNQEQGGRAFSLATGLAFAITLSIILIASAALRDWLGETGVILATGLAGFVDTHAAAISAASLVATGKLRAADATIPILVGFSTNTISKGIFAVTSGGRSFALRVIPGLIIVAALAWAGAFYVLSTG
jgi:uncharacterized membrane protein (DUF4010 family)